MSDRLRVVAWAVAVTAASAIHDLRALAVGIALAALAAGPRAPRALRRAGLAVGVFGGVVGLTWLAAAVATGDPPLPAALRAVARLELRAFLLALLTFGWLARVDPDRVLAPWPTVRAGVRVVLAQIALFRRLLEDYADAFECRRLGPARWTDRLRHAAAGAGGLVGRALHESEEVALAMDARGLLPSIAAGGPGPAPLPAPPPRTPSRPEAPS